MQSLTAHWTGRLQHSYIFMYNFYRAMNSCGVARFLATAVSTVFLLVDIKMCRFVLCYVSALSAAVLTFNLAYSSMSRITFLLVHLLYLVPGVVPTVMSLSIVSLSHLTTMYTVSQKNDTDVTHYRFNPHQPISAIFGRHVAERVCYWMVIYYLTSPN